MVAGGVAVASLTAVAAPAAAKAPTTTNDSASAAAYLARNLGGAHHDHFTSSYTDSGKTYTYVNYGETADAILSMDAAGEAQDAASRATKYLAAHAASYAGTASGGYSPGAIGKLMLVAAAQHVSVRSFGGIDLVTAVASTEGSGDAQPGEYQQNPPGTDPSDEYFSTVGQSLPILAMAESPDAADQPDAAAVSFLAGQQCSDGGWPSQLLNDPAAACAAGSDVDSTAYAVQALLAAGDHGPALTGLHFLKHVQHANGSFGATPNSNSTAVAIEALAAGRRSIHDAVVWLKGRQLGCSSSTRHRGAVRYEEKGFDDASALLATSQAGAALAEQALAWIDRNGAHHATPRLACSKK
jgi:hypothetical protein